jgi:hypothetical protein
MAVFALLSTVWLVLGASGAFADRRVALVIGNSQYKDASIALANPASDAQDIAAALKALDFEVSLTLDASIRQMDEVLTSFGSMAANADVALVFYAGHALQFQGKNYLMPIDASLNDEIDLRRSMVDDEQIRIALDRTSGVKILILDACRNNPLADRFTQRTFGKTRAVEATRGLARIDKAQGMVIAYAAEPGKVAFDANTTGKISPFTTALLRRMQEPALEISTMLRRVAQDVWDQTRGQQRPEYSSSLLSDYFLDPMADKHKWDRIRESVDPSELREFVNQFPRSPYVLDAQRRLEILNRSRRERDEEARLESERLEADRVRRGVCQRETNELAAIGNDFAKLQTFIDGATCDQARASARDKFNAITAQRDEEKRREEARRRDDERRQMTDLCRNEQATVDALGSDLAKLQDFARRAACDPVRALANDRIKTLVAQQEAEAKKQQEAERTCRGEQETLVSLGNDLSKLQVFLRQVTCEPVRAAAGERIKSAQQRDREQTETQQQAARTCQAELAAMTPAWNDLARLQDMAGRSACAEVRPRLTARINELVAAQQEAQESQKKGAERLAALEDERNRLRREEEQRQHAEKKRQDAAKACQDEGVELASLEGDLAKLKLFVKRSGCEDVRALTNAKITQIERDENACKDANTKRNALLSETNKRTDRSRLTGFMQDMMKLEQEMACARLRPSVAAAVETIRVKMAQAELKRVGCYSGNADGVSNEATREAMKLFFVKEGAEGGDITELLSDLKDMKDGFCNPAPASPPVADHQKKEKAPTKRQASAPSRQEAPRRQERQSGPARTSSRAEPRAAPSYHPAAPMGGGGAIIGIGH